MKNYDSKAALITPINNRFDWVDGGGGGGGGRNLMRRRRRNRQSPKRRRRDGEIKDHEAHGQRGNLSSFTRIGSRSRGRKQQKRSQGRETNEGTKRRKPNGFIALLTAQHGRNSCSPWTRDRVAIGPSIDRYCTARTVYGACHPRRSLPKRGGRREEGGGGGEKSRQGMIAKWIVIHGHIR